MEDKRYGGLSPQEYGAKNDFASVRVPVEAKWSAYKVSTAIIGIIIALSAIYTGAAFIGGLNLKEALLANFAGNLILCVYAGLMGIIGAKEGMSVTMISRHSFGRSGSVLISAIVAISLMGWYGWQCNFFGATIHTMLPSAGIITDPVVAGIWGGLLMMITAYIGSNGLAKLSAIAAPLILLMAVIAAVVGMNMVGGWSSLMALSETEVTAGSMTVGTAIVSVVGAYATGGIIQPDITRFSKTAKQSLWAAILGFMVAQFLVILSGYIICLTTAQSDVAAALLATLGAASLIVLILAQWTTNDNNLYSSSLAICSLNPKLNKKKVVIVVGLIAVVVGASGLVNSFVGFLIILGIMVPPVGGIIIADYFILKKQSYQFGQGTVYGFASLPAFIAWIVAIIVGFKVAVGIGCINSMVTAMVVYLLLEGCFKSNADKKYVGGFVMENAYGDTEKYEK